MERVAGAALGLRRRFANRHAAALVGAARCGLYRERDEGGHELTLMGGELCISHCRFTSSPDAGAPAEAHDDLAIMPELVFIP